MLDLIAILCGTLLGYGLLKLIRFALKKFNFLRKRQSSNLNKFARQQFSEPIKPTNDYRQQFPEPIEQTNDFGFRLLSQLNSDREPNENIIISSFSIALALAMIYNGAKGKTKEAISQTLGLTGLSLEEINESNRILISIQDQFDPKVELNIANSIWVRQEIPLVSEFIDRLENSYASKITSLDFEDFKAANIINQWIANQTRNKIPQIVSHEIVRNNILLLINAIYFKGKWTKEFDKEKTKDRLFTLLDGSQKKHPMLADWGYYDYYETKKFQAISLPYGNRRISLYIFLPTSNSSIKEFQKSLNSRNWQKWMASFEELEGFIALPRFKLEYETYLNNVLTNLGMGIAFDKEDANFQGISTEPLMISKILHKTLVEVNEKGTEAVAVTAIMIGSSSMGPTKEKKKFKMIVDRPFFCAIRDNQTGVILFMGFIREPILI
jgi:serpin B